jgi:hypothetical protein
MAVGRLHLPVEKCSAKPTVFGVVTNPNRIHSVFSLGQQTERERLFHQNITGRSRQRIVDSPNLGFLGRGDRSYARADVQELNFREFRGRDVNILALPAPKVAGFAAPLAPLSPSERGMLNECR